MLHQILVMASRILMGFVCLLAYMHILGKMQLAPTSPIDQIGNYVLGGIIGGIIYNLELPIWQFFCAMFVWAGLMIVVNVIRRKNLVAKRLVDGPPILCMKNGVLFADNLRHAKISADDLVSRLHQSNVAKIDDISMLWLEPNGQLTIVRKDDEQLAWTLIEDGQMNRLDMAMSQVREEWVLEEIERQGYSDIKQIYCAQLTRTGLQIYPYEYEHEEDE